MSQPDEIVSPIATERPMLTLSSAAINTVPVELDGTPASPQKVHTMMRSSRDDILKELSPEDQEVRSILCSATRLMIAICHGHV